MLNALIMGIAGWGSGEVFAGAEVCGDGGLRRLLGACLEGVVASRVWVYWGITKTKNRVVAK